MCCLETTPYVISHKINGVGQSLEVTGPIALSVLYI